ncbi:MAG: methylmalonyl-CoA mutase family protein [Thermoleophilia bacterium]
MPNDSDAPMALAAGFPAADRERWMAEVARVLARGRDDAGPAEIDALFARVLRTPTYDGITLEPLYTAGDAPPPGSEGLPGLAPFVRGSAPHAGPGGWDARQVVAVEGDGASAAGHALDELENGAVSVQLDLRGADRIDVALLDRVLGGVLLSAAAVGLDAGRRGVEAAAALAGLWAERDVPDGAALASLGLDPLGEHATAGGARPLDRELSQAVAVAVEASARRPGVRAMVADGSRYHGAGGSDAEQLGAALATGVAYLRALTDAGLTPDAACGQVELRLAASAGQFPTIALMRAARLAWARVAEVAGASPAARAARIHAVTSPAMATRYDPWVNLLRNTVACFAAGAGGADVVTVAPHDGAGGDLARRLARNTQALLVDECGLARVADPAGGSWFVERLTRQLADAAWAFLQRIEAAGGMAAALDAGLVQERIAATWRARATNLARRRDPVTGVSEFPDIDEPAPAAAPAGAGGGSIPALVPHRYGEPFEALRDRARAAATPPTVFLATLGTAAAHTARATFAKNLFEAGGIRALPSGDLGEGDDLAEAFRASRAPIACICSSDAVYAERAAAAAAALSGAGAARVYLAGRGGEREAALREAGVDEFAHAGVDAARLLARALDAAGAP